MENKIDLDALVKSLRICGGGALSCEGCMLRDTSNQYSSCWDQIGNAADDAIEQLCAELARVKRERDAAVRDLGIYDMCVTCKFAKTSLGDVPCVNCSFNKEYVWRGLCEENGVQNEKV